LTWESQADKVSQGEFGNMLEIIEKLLVLQDRDRRINQLRQELQRLEPERRQLEAGVSEAQKEFEAAKQKLAQIESERRQLELDINSKQQNIERYSLQQFQTRKNEEYRALSHEIELNKKQIFELENRVLDLMEQAENTQKAITIAAQKAKNIRETADKQMAIISEREKNLHAELESLEAERKLLADGIESGSLRKYERILKSKGENVVVGIEHGVCGGCHMKLSRQTVVECRADQGIITCVHCGRILYYAPGMDVSVVDE